MNDNINKKFSIYFIYMLFILLLLYFCLLYNQKLEREIRADVRASYFKSCTILGLDFDLSYHYYYYYNEVSKDWINQKEQEAREWQNKCFIGKLKK